MQNYVPRLILIDSNTIKYYSFLCGFLSFPDGNTSSINPATLIPGEEDNLPYLLYTQNTNEIYDAIIEALPFFTFTPENEIPNEFDVMFQTSDGDKKKKIKVTATMGHPDIDFPELYIARPLILKDMNSQQDGSGKLCYGFLLDIHEGDMIRWESSEWDNVIVSIDSSNATENIITSLTLFPLDAVLPSFQLDLEPQGFGDKLISYENAPLFQTIDDEV